MAIARFLRPMLPHTNVVQWVIHSRTQTGIQQTQHETPAIPNDLGIGNS